MAAYIDRMRNIRPQHGIPYGNIAWTTPPVPAMIIERNTIIPRTKKSIINKYFTATHHVDAITPAFATKSFQVTDNYLRRTATEHCIMLGIYNRNSINQYILGIGYFNTADRMI